MSTGWKLDRQQREELLRQYPPRYPHTVADHVTFAPIGVEPVPDPVAEARIVGKADDGSGVEAMVVELNGSTRRPDGGTWHITWSLGHGRQAKESNDVIAAKGYEGTNGPGVVLTPASW